MKSHLLLAAICTLAACSDLFEGNAPTGKGAIELNFVEYSGVSATKAVSDFPDTNKFLLKISDSKGNTIYDGTFGAAPKTIPAESGTYIVETVSRDFNAPLFDAPQYGDSQVVEVKAGKTSKVRLNCTMLNSGVIIRAGTDFVAAYPSATLTLSSAEGTLMYGYSEKRTAYFKPGHVTLNMNEGGNGKTILSRNLEPRQVLTLNLSAGNASTSKSGISISVDTSKVRTGERIVVGSERGDDPGNALDVERARAGAGSSDVWVYGYIVGGDLTSSRCSFEVPFSSKTNLVLASRSSCTERSECLSVQLSTQGGIREALNLVDHPDNLGRQIFLKGDLVEAYYGLPGLQSVSSFQWESTP